MIHSDIDGGDDTIRVLHVDDDPSLADLTATFLQREDDRFSIETATDASEGLARLTDDSFDCIISDHDMPGQNGVEFLETVREDYPDLPFILYTGKGSEEIASDAISAGVTDYLQKERGTDQYRILANRIRNNVERYRIEREADRTRTQLQAIADNSADAIVLIDAESRIRFANQAIEDHVGYHPTELNGERLTMLMPERHRENHLSALSQYVETGEQSLNWSHVEFPGLHKDGTEIPLSISFSEFEQDGEQRFLGIIRNISKRVQMEERLDEREERFRQVAENIREVVWMSDLENDEVLYVNSAYEEVWGRSAESLYDDPTSFLDAIHPDDRERVEAALDTQVVGGYDEEYRIVRPDGERRWVHDRAVPVENDSDDVSRIVGVASDITERREQEQKRERIITRVTDAIVEVNADWQFTLVNEQAERLYDMDETYLLARNFWDVFDEARGTRFEEEYRRVMESREPTSFVEYFSQLDGWFDISAYPKADGGIAFYFVELTEQRERQQELEQANTVLSTLFETLPLGVLAEDSDRNVLAVNDHLFDLLELPGSPAELEGADCERITERVSEPFVDSKRFVERINDLVANREPTDTAEVALQDGRTFDRSYRQLELPDGVGHLWVYRDITERTDLEQRLEALNRITQKLMSADTQDEIVDIGIETTRDLLGIEANSIHLYDEADDALVPASITDAAVDLIGEPPTFTGEDSIAWRGYQQGETLAVDDVHEEPNRHNPATSIRSELILPLDGYGVLLAGSPSPETFNERDVLLGEILAGGLATALEQVEQTEQLHTRERELTNQNDRLEQFASIVSHDLRNPLNVAEGRLELATTECDSEHLDHVEYAHERMRTLIENLLTLAREGEAVTDVEPVTLAPLVEECWATVETDATTLVIDTNRTVQADKSRLKQLFENLMRNSVEHGSTSSRTPSGDSVEHGGEDVTVTVGALDHGFYIEDDGPGIPVTERDDVFKAGYSTSEDGTGFGLSIVKQIVEAHDWELRVTEGTAGGARFEITGIETAAE